MVKKLFALASVSALAGLMASVSAAGCSSTTEESPAETTKDAGPDAKGPKTTPTDGGDDTDTDTSADQCWKDDAIDISDFAYKPARVQNGACTEKVFDVIDEVSKDDNAKWSDLEAAIAKDESQKCADCVFGAEDAASWAPIIGPGDGTNMVNIGGCVEIVSGKEACGKGFAAWAACLDTACKDCGDNDQTACAKAVQSTACKDATEAFATACGSNVQTYIDACNKKGEGSIVGPIRKQCIDSGVKDGGS